MSRIHPVTTDPTSDSTAYIAPMTNSEMTFAAITWTRLGVARNVEVTVLWRYSDPIVMTPMARVRR